MIKISGNDQVQIFHLSGILEKAKYISMLLKKGIPKMYFIKLIMVSLVLLNNRKKWGTSSL